MDALKAEFKTVDEYIAMFPAEAQARMQAIREAIHKIAPDVQETIKYKMPTFMLNGKNLVYFAGFKSHIGFYPIPSGMEAFKKELSAYKMGKGSVQFPLDERLPLPLIKKIVRFRVKENRKG